MRLRHGRAADERSAAALRRLAIMRADLSGAGHDDDDHVDVSEEHHEVDEGGGDPRPLPDAGRHLAPSVPPRRSWLGGLHDRLPLFVHARLGGAGLTAQHVVVVVAVVVGFLALAVWWLVSSRPSEVTPMSTVNTRTEPSSTGQPSAGDPTSDGTTADPQSEGGGKVVIDVAGKVRDPGIVSLREGSRVADAIEAAGGPVRRGVDLTALNLARVLVDGEQILVGIPAASPSVAQPTESAPDAGAEPGSLVNLNTATLEQLDTLPGVGPVTGQAILDWRTEHQQFTSVDELLEIDGIGEVTLEELRELVTV